MEQLHGGTRPLDEVTEGMKSALAYVQACEITRATRDVELDGVTVQQGQ